MFFDIGVGLLLASMIGVISGTDSLGLMLLVGLFGGLWPDSSFLFWIAAGHDMDLLSHKQRDILHKPLLLVPALSVVVYLMLGSYPLLVFLLASIAHFVHDSTGQGWGIKWLWPLNDHYYCYRSIGGHEAKLHSWTPVKHDVAHFLYGEGGWARHS